MKTTFSSGVIVTSEFLNGFQQISFDGQDLDHHYPPLGLSSLVRTGPNGLDGVYLTLSTSQPVLSNTGLYASGNAISGTKVVVGIWNFGYDPLQVGNPPNVIEYAPKSYTTNDKFDYANGTFTPTAAQKFASLADADIVTKQVVEQWVGYLLENLEIDNGVYYSAADPACQNYSVGAGNSDVVCAA